MAKIFSKVKRLLHYPFDSQKSPSLKHRRHRYLRLGKNLTSLYWQVFVKLSSPPTLRCVCHVTPVHLLWEFNGPMLWRSQCLCAPWVETMGPTRRRRCSQLGTPDCGLPFPSPAMLGSVVPTALWPLIFFSFCSLKDWGSRWHHQGGCFASEDWQGVRSQSSQTCVPPRVCDLKANYCPCNFKYEPIPVNYCK